MADSSGKRFREAKKRQQREIKAQRKQMRKDGLLGNDNSGLFAPGEMPRQVVDVNAPATPDPDAPPGAEVASSSSEGGAPSATPTPTPNSGPQGKSKP